MSSTVIQIQKRDTKTHAELKALLAKDLVPGVVYGDAIETRHIAIKKNDLFKAMHNKTGTGLFDVQIDGEKDSVKVLVQEWQNNPVSDAITHVDLYQVRMDKKVHTEIPLNFIGVSLAVKNLGGTLIKQTDELEIECLPGDLVNHIDVSIDLLATFDDAIYVRDLVLPAGVTARLDADAIIAKVAAPRTEEELAGLNTEIAVDVSKVEVTTEKKEKPEAGAEVATPDAQ